MSLRILKNINTAKAFFFTEVLADDSDKIVKALVKALLVLQVLHLLCELVEIK